MVLKAVVKALKKADKLKEKIQSNKDLLSDNEAWMTQQQLQRVYQQVLILDLEYALDKKVEQELWNHGFKNFIANLQAIAKDKKKTGTTHPRRSHIRHFADQTAASIISGSIQFWVSLCSYTDDAGSSLVSKMSDMASSQNPNHSESQALLYWCLEAASGFYLTLLHEICSAFDLDLPFRRKGNVFGCNKNVSSLESHCHPNKSSCYYICQHCLVHLGDIARYRNQSRQAEAFYRYAVQLSPGSGQPYNQLAILEASRGDKLSTVYHYVRSVALRHPFPVASTNLTRTLHKHAEETVKLEGHGKLSSCEYVSAFLKLHGLLHSSTELDTAEKLVQILTTSLTSHIATESLSSWKLVQIVTINIFALRNAGGGVDGKSTTFSESELTPDEQRIKLLITDFLAACLTAFLLPVYTIKPGEPLLEYFAMPAVKLTLEWIRQEPEVLEKSSFKNRLQIWPSLCKVLNDIQPVINDFPAENYAHVPLPEDRDLQGFLPFEKSFQHLKFYTEDLKIDNLSLNKLRACRMVDFGIWLSQQTSLNIVNCSKNCDSDHKSGSYLLFEAAGRQEPPSGEQIREIEEMILTKLPSPTPSDASGSVTGASTPDSSGVFSSVLSNPFFKFKTSEFSSQENLQDKRPGILKCQSSTEKIEKGVKAGSNRGQRNVALQAIINRNTEETKQVTFRTPSPPKETAASQSPKKNLNSKKEEQKFFNSEDVKKEKKFMQQARDWNNWKIHNKNSSEENEAAKSGIEGSNSRGGKKQGKTEAEGKLAKKKDKEKGKEKEKDKEKEKETPFSEFTTAFPPLPCSRDALKNSVVWSSEEFKEFEKEVERNPEENFGHKNLNKQQLLSELFSKSKSPEVEQKQPQNMSGLLNLSKQQQKMLTDSKSLRSRTPPPPPPQSQQPQFPQPQSQHMHLHKMFNSDLTNAQNNVAIQKLKYVDKMEAARKEYEAAVFALQKKQSQEPQRLYSGAEPDLSPYDYDRRMNIQAPAPPPQVQQQNQLQHQHQHQHQPQVYLRVNQPLINVGSFGFKYPTQFFLPWQEPQEPPLPPSWWSESPQNHPPPQQMPENFAPGPPASCPRESVYPHQMPQNNPGVQPVGVGVGGSSYSLFSTSSWNSVRPGDNEPDQNYGLSGGIMAQQSFWSGPGPSPLERLLEQQKQMRKAAPDSKNGT